MSLLPQTSGSKYYCKGQVTQIRYLYWHFCHFDLPIASSWTSLTGITFKKRDTLLFEIRSKRPGHRPQVKNYWISLLKTLALKTLASYLYLMAEAWRVRWIKIEEPSLLYWWFMAYEYLTTIISFDFMTHQIKDKGNPPSFSALWG